MIHKIEDGHTFGSELNAYNKGVNFSIGYEWTVTKGRLSTYLTFDVIQAFGQRSRDGYYYGCWSSGSYDDKHNYYQLGIAPGLGLDISLTKRWSVNLESNTVARKEIRSETFVDYWNPQFKIMINPISRFSLNYRLNQKKSQH